MTDLKHYKLDQIISLLRKAEEQGYPLEKGSYLEQLTIGQLDDLVNRGKHDA